MTLQFNENDGGRARAGYKGTAGDCVCRAIAICLNISYEESRDLITEYALKERGKGKKKRKSHYRTGVFTPTTKKIMADHDWTWVPTMKIGAGTLVHCTTNELPSGVLMLNLSKHISSMIDGVLQDTYDCSREGTRCVYGIWTKDQDSVEWMREQYARLLEEKGIES